MNTNKSLFSGKRGLYASHQPLHTNAGNRRPNTAIDIGKPVNLTGGIEFSNLTYTGIKKKDINGKWVKQ